MNFSITKPSSSSKFWGALGDDTKQDLYWPIILVVLNTSKSISIKSGLTGHENSFTPDKEDYIIPLIKNDVLTIKRGSATKSIKWENILHITANFPKKFMYSFVLIADDTLKWSKYYSSVRTYTSTAFLPYSTSERNPIIQASNASSKFSFCVDCSNLDNNNAFQKDVLYDITIIPDNFTVDCTDLGWSNTSACYDNRDILTSSQKDDICDTSEKNLKSTFCEGHCKLQNANCSSGMLKFCKDITYEFNIEEDDPDADWKKKYCGCYLNEETYSDWMKPLVDVDIRAATYDARCWYGLCATSDFKHPGAKNTPCPSITQCINEVNIEDVNIQGGMEIDVSNECSSTLGESLDQAEAEAAEAEAEAGTNGETEWYKNIYIIIGIIVAILVLFAMLYFALRNKKPKMVKRIIKK